MKYIDSEKLIAEIERMRKFNNSMSNNAINSNMRNFYDGEIDCCKQLISFINSLQQEQPIKVYRVENEKEQKGLWRKFDGIWEPLFDILTDGQCKDMPMEDNPIYREGGKQWFASAPSKETLQKWFSKRDLEELTAKGFTISEFEVVGYKKINDFEYIFTRDNIISRTYLKVSDIYPQEQDELTWKDIKQIIQIADGMLTNTAWDAIDYPDEQKYYEQVLKQYKKQKNK